MKTAILQVADTGPLESLVIMLRSVGYHCCLPSDGLKHQLRSLGCDTVLDVDHLVKHWGYDPPMPLPLAGLTDMLRSDVVYVDVKGHKNHAKVVAKWPNLKGRVLWYRINGGKPEHVVNASGDHGDEVHPPCPVLTPNQWYRNGEVEITPEERTEGWVKKTWCPSYSCWPPFVRWDDHTKAVRPISVYGPPVCLVHNLAGWGHGRLVEPLHVTGLRMHGVSSPHGLIPHAKSNELLVNAVAMVHLKSSDAPGYALYEALATGCPVICSRRLIWRNRMQELFVPGETCLTFDRETHEGLSDEDVTNCTREIGDALSRLRDPAFNQRIGVAGRERLLELMWSDLHNEDVDSLKAFMTRHFG